MKFDPFKIRKDSESNFTSAWLKYSQELPRNTSLKLIKKGKSHPVNNLIQKFRDVLIKMGFEEVINKTIIPEHEIYWQYGPEAGVILDRVFYLAKLPRKELGLEKERIEKIKEIIGEFDIEKLQEIFRSYKKGKIEADNLIEEIARGLNKSQEKITLLFDSGVLSDLSKLEPEVTKLTLRSHMTAAWFSTLQEYQDKTYPPIALFSIGLRYRNEQREDAEHLRVHNSASIVIMDPNISLEAGEKIVKDILKEIGFEKVTFQMKEITSTYYAYGQEKEVFVEYEGKSWEIGDIGMYSPIALSYYNIKYPVFNAGFGIERIATIINKCRDIRKVVYHYKFMEPEVNDNLIRMRLRYIDKPTTLIGEKIAHKIEEVATKKKDAVGPCEFLIYQDEKIEVYIVEREPGKKLLGPAALNELNVHNCAIYATPQKTQYSIGISYLKALSKRLAAFIEKFYSSDEIEKYYKIRMVRSLPDVNLEIDEYILKYLTGKKKKINIKGPVFITIYVRKKEEQ